LVAHIQRGNSETPAAGRGILRRLNASLAGHGAWFVVAFVIVNGVGTVDFDDFRVLATHPFALHPALGRQFLQSSPLTYLLGAPLAKVVGVTAAYCIVALVGLAIAWYGIARWLQRFRASETAIVALVLSATPLLLVLTRWLGKSDAFLLGFYLAFAALEPSRRFAKSVLVVGMVLAHREIGTIALVGHVVLFRRDFAAIVIGSAIGHGTIFAYHHAVLPSPPESRVAVAERLTAETIDAFVRAPFAHLAVSFNWFWIFLATCRARSDAALWMFIAGIVAAAAFALDYTRVVTLCALPIYLHVGERLASAPDSVPRFLRAFPFPLAFVLQFQFELGQVHDFSWFR
jgi:hypothetical protein